MVYLDKYVKARSVQRHHAILTGERRQHVIMQIIDILDDFRLSKFENEGAIRAGVRSALCLAGNAWHPSDQEATGLLNVAFMTIGATRPTWLEGQREFATSREECSWCGEGLTDLALARRERFCGVTCARAALSYRSYGTHFNDDPMGRQAYRIILQSQTPPRTCDQCGCSYQAIRVGSDQRYCSHRCRDASKRIIPDRDCLHCGLSFRPSKMSNSCCSPKCSADHRFQLAEIHKTCRCCGTEFVAKISTAAYCSGSCKKKAWKKKTQHARTAPLTPRVFDSWFKLAA